MKETTLCYIEKDKQYLMLYRNKKQADPNEGKWIGVGGKLEIGETPEQCLLREVREETGLELTEYTQRGTIYFCSDTWEDEVMYLFTATGFCGEITRDCEEGELKWIPFEEIMDLNLWEGDRVFLKALLEEKSNINITLQYQGERLMSCTENKPKLLREGVTPLFDSPYIKVFDLSYQEGKHYYNASRRNKDNLVALKEEKDFKEMLPDAVSCVVILQLEGKEPLLCLNKEFRFPAGQFLLSIPAGLLDEEDKMEPQPIFSAAIRELWEETGITMEDGDEIKMVNPLLFSSPGMTDESNAVVQILLKRKDLPKMTQEGAVGGECFDGFSLITKKEAMEILKAGRDEAGIYYSVYTWIGLMCFVSGIWE